MGGDTFVRSMLGTQTLANKISAPSYGFGSGTRDHREKLFESEAHSLRQVTNKSPGPAVYNKDGTLGLNVDSELPTLPQWRFGTGERFSKPTKEQLKFPGPGGSAESPIQMKSSVGQQVTSLSPSNPVYSLGTSTRGGVQKVYLSDKHSMSQFQGHISPGPAGYSLKGALGKQDGSNDITQPSWVFGSNQRFRDPDLERAGKLPSPDKYTKPSGVGLQSDSTKRSAPLPGFGTSTRENAAKVFLTPAHEKVNFGKVSPGPLSYTLTPGVGKQVASGKRESPSFGFGSNDRWYTRKIAERHGNYPAPGAYNV